jgi:excinuclease UvrABC nuclease subunit
MEIKIRIPLKADIVFQPIPILVAKAGQEWLSSQLGAYTSKSGVYIHHCNGKILYVGKTTSGPWGTFAERFRRQFQEGASQKSSLHQLLCRQSAVIKTVMFDLDDLDMMVDSGPIRLEKVTKALIMEQILIGIFQPEGNKSGINQTESS